MGEQIIHDGGFFSIKITEDFLHPVAQEYVP